VKQGIRLKQALSSIRSTHVKLYTGQQLKALSTHMSSAQELKCYLPVHRTAIESTASHEYRYEAMKEITIPQYMHE
jgi:hypothetical protein